MLLGGFFFTRQNLEVIMGKKVSRDNFNFGRGEETSWTSPEAVSKIDVISASCRVLILKFISGCATEVIETQSVKVHWVRVQFGVLVDVVAIDHDQSSFWDDFTSGQFETFRVGDDTRDVDLEILVCGN